MQFLRTRRTYRRFKQTPVPAAVVDDILEAARIASCGANRQTLKYLVVQSPEQVAKVGALVHWAAYLPPEQGTPGPEEGPTLFVAVFQDDALPGANDTDAGLALGSMTAVAWSHGVGSCIMGAIDRPALCDLFGTAPSLRLHSMVAFGYPAHESRVVEMRDGDVRYYLDDARDYCVPKRPLSEILLGRF
ncbi:MAG TPA: nitroreductase family protein [Candidatus Gemmiger faecavium]|nr:nitroreductase family protein [Candidatus Gemmiger faecavium]